MFLLLLLLLLLLLFLLVLYRSAKCFVCKIFKSHSIKKVPIQFVQEVFTKFKILFKIGQDFLDMQYTVIFENFDIITQKEAFLRGL